MALDFLLVDAFTRQRFEGAQVAVFPQAGELSDEQMQLLARELNLTESVFILPAGDGLQADIRIFTPVQEVQYAGHPLIAGLYALYLAQPDLPRQFDISLAGRRLSIAVNDRVEGEDVKIYYLCSESIRMDSFVPSARELAEFLGCHEKDIAQEYAPMLVSRGDDYLIVPVKNQQILQSAVFNQNKWQMSFVASLANRILLFCENPQDPTVDFCGRLLGKGISEHEDPPVGPAAPAFAAYLMHDQDEAKRAIVLQRGGGELRKSLIHIQMEKAAGTPRIMVGGSAVLVARGQMEIP